MDDDAVATSTAAEVEPRRNVIRKLKETSSFYGVSWDKTALRWYARMRINNVRVYVGVFTREIEAAKAIDAYLRSKGLHTSKGLNFRSQADIDAGIRSAQSGPQCTSNYKGVMYVNRSAKGPWRASVQVKGKKHILGDFPTEEEAARAYDVEARKLGRLVNFPTSADEDRQSAAQVFARETSSNKESQLKLLRRDAHLSYKRRRAEREERQVELADSDEETEDEGEWEESDGEEAEAGTGAAAADAPQPGSPHRKRPADSMTGSSPGNACRGSLRPARVAKTSARNSIADVLARADSPEPNDESAKIPYRPRVPKPAPAVPVVVAAPPAPSGYPAPPLMAAHPDDGREVTL